MATLQAILLPTIIYRVFLHPLAKYPGPWLAKITNLYAAYHSWKGDIHKDMYRLHLKYGDHVRYAPNRVLINTPEALQRIHGHGNNVKKFEGYKVLAANAANTLTLSDKTQHAWRRRVISQAFSENSLRLFAPKVRARIDRFCEVIRQHGQSTAWTSPLDMALYFNYLTFDTMTAVTFDTDYHLTDQPKYRYVIGAIEAANIRLGIISQALELTIFNIDRTLFLESAKAAWTFGKFIYKLLRARLEKKSSDNQDIFAFLQKCRDPDTGKGLSDTELSTETATFVVAGSDTTATTLAAVTHYLTHSPSSYRRVCDEIRQNFPDSTSISIGPQLNSCQFLRACIDESLRLSPPGGSAPWREVDRGGTTIDGQYLPEGCEVGTAVYTIHHDERYWESPFSFDPDRWLPPASDANQSQKTSAKRPYVPFGLGPRSCVGRPLAITQMMLALAIVIREFDFRRVDQADSWWNLPDEGSTEYELTEHITSSRVGPILCFKSVTECS
ncbi:cytochrome P450 [Lepidopterella palustris CBS 459.81]|uniref:Cytochrome P450 n=1 Tax=Lepidopterella palustris CBS 459.81 TaxID=1314670 RepID=A0A8E2E4Q3_9PEZI|nr:cytochrome P450 [Lepidopterella palustris CBS 459.81]